MCISGSGSVIGLFINCEAIIGCISFSAIMSAIGFMGFVLYEVLLEEVIDVGLFMLAYTVLHIRKSVREQIL